MPSRKKTTRKPSKSKKRGVNVVGGNSLTDILSKIVITLPPEMGNMEPRMAGDSSTDAPPPEVTKKKGKGT